MWDYSEKVVDHFLHPRNVGEIENPDGMGEVGSLACGDMLRLTFTLDENGKIADVRFKTFGCASAIASSSALTEMIKGKTLEEAERITNRDIAEYLGGLPEEKMHCSVMGREALEAAIKNYRGEAAGHKDLSGRIVCNCFGITEDEIRRVAAENNLTTIKEVTNFTKAGGACGKCHGSIQEILDEIYGRVKPSKPKPAEPKFNHLERIHKIEELMEKRIRPLLQHDGGDVKLIDIDNNTVFVTLTGACAVCGSSGRTLKQFIEKELKREISRDIKIEEVIA